MSAREKPGPPADPHDEIAALIEVLRHAGQRLEELTGGVDTVASRDGRTSLDTLAQSESGLHRAEVMAKLAHLITGPEGIFERWSQTLPRLIGVEPSALPRTTRAWLDLLHPDDRADFRESAINASTDKLRVELQYRLRKAGGEWIYIRQTMEPLKSDDDAGVHLRWFNTLQDVTQEVKAEESLRRFASAMDATVDAIYLVDRSTLSFLHVNETACRMQGMTREALMALGPAKLLKVSPHELERTYDALIQSGAGSEPVEMLRTRENGSQAWVELRRHALRSGDGWMIVTLVRDVTERRKAAERIAYLNRVHAVLSGINALIVRVFDRDELFREACRIAVDDGGFRMAWIGVPDKAAGNLLPIASAGVPEPLLASIQAFYSLPDGRQTGSTRAEQAMASKLPAVINDLASEGDFELARKHVDAGINSMAIFPLIVSGTSAGVLTLYASESRFFLEEELILLKGLANDIAFALRHIDETRKLARITRVNAILSGVNAAIVHIRNPAELFAEVCRIAVESGGLRLAWIFAVDEAGGQLRQVASAGGDQALLGLIGNRLSLRDDAPEGPSLGAKAVLEGCAQVINDMDAHPDEVYLAAFAKRGMKSVAVLPLSVAGRVACIFALHAAEVGFFNDHEMKLLKEVAENISFALEHIEKAGKLERMTRVNAMLSAINGAIVRIRESQALFDEACRIAVETGGLAFAWLCVVDEAEQRLRPVASAGPDDGFLELIRGRFSLRDDAPEGHGIGARSVRDRRVLVVNDIQAADLRFKNAHAERGIKSAASLPVSIAGRIVGAFGLHARETDFFDEEEMKLLEEVAGNIAFALEHMEKEKKVQRLTRVYAVLSGINTLIVRVRERDELFREACRIAVEDGKFQMAFIGIVDRSAMKLVPAASAGADEGFFETIFERMSLLDDAPAGQGPPVLAVKGKRAVIVNDLAADARVLHKEAHAQNGVRALVSLPLLIAGEAVGVLDLHAMETGYFDEAEMTLLLELAGDIAFAIQNIDQQRKLDKLARMQAVSSGIDAAIVRVRDPTALLKETCRVVVEHGKFDLAWTAFLDQAHRRVEPVAWAGFSAQAAHGVVWPGEGTANGMTEVIRTRKVAVRNDITSEPPSGSLRVVALRKGYHTCVCVPLMIDDSVAGAIVLYAKEPGFFDAEEIALLEGVAANLSFALQAIKKQEALDRSESLKSAILASSLDCVVTIDHEGRIVEFNAAAEATFGLPAGQALGKSMVDLIVPPRLRDAHNRGFAHLLATGEGPILGKRLELEAVRADGTEFPIELAITATGGMAKPMFTGFIRDITERRAAEAKIKRLNRVYAVLSGINALIVRARGREELFQESCKIAVEHGGFEMAWIGTVDRAAMKVVPSASEDVDAEFLPLVKDGFSLLENAPMGNTMVARAVREKKALVSNLIREDSGVVLRKIHIARGIASMAVLPLLASDAAVGVLALYAGESGFFDDEELKLLTELAGHISLALEHIEKGEKLDYLAYYDPLTGLANRALFLERVAQHMRGAAAGGHELAVFLLDLERFKNINDSLGRAAGDALLKQIAEWLTVGAGDSSLVARIGADHFALVVPHVREDDDVTRLFESRVEAFLHHPFRLNDTVLRLSLKGGIARFPADGASADTLLRNAEAALKKAKASGERYLFYTQAMNERVAEKLSLENQLRQALEREEFVLHYQPKVALADNALTGAEALIRWNDPQTGLVPPGRFIPILEETGLIYEVGRWALRKAIEDYLRWRAAGLPAPRIAVNVSPLQLRNRGFAAEVQAAIGVHADAAAGLELEITESLIMEDVKHSIASLKALRAMGVTIAIDDFGTGFSSLSYLSKLPVDTLKIDRSFVVDMTAGPEGLALVSTIINLAHSLRLKVVAEGVETEEQSRLLRLLGCDEIQGYLFSKPVPGADFETRFLAPPP